MSVSAAEPGIDLGGLWRRSRRPALFAVVAGSCIVALALLGTQSNNRTLDPRNTAPAGAHALAVLLAERGVAESIPTSLTQVSSESTTAVLLADPQALPTAALATIARGSATVIAIDPTQRELAALGVAAKVDNETLGATLQPRCPVAIAQTAGAVQVSGYLYRVGAGSTGCYFQGGDASLVESRRSAGGVTYVLGSVSALSNAMLGSEGNAALGLGLLDSHLVQWVTGDIAVGPVPHSQQGLLNLLPSRLLWATLELFIAVALFALWRARRLGSPVAEPLPVIVRAAETVEGRARLMRAAKARDGAAGALREATIRRLSSVLRIGTDDDAAAVSALIAERTGRPATEVAELLYGGDPRDDAALVRLAQDLPALETAVRHVKAGSQ